MKLYYAPGTCARACWIALEWANADYTVENVDYSSPEYKKVNPLGMVPALDIGGKRAMTEAGAILNYIADRYPESDLGSLPGIENELEFNETMSFLTGDVHPAYWPLFFPQRFTTLTDEKSLEAAKEASYPRIDKVLKHLDDLIGDTDHVYQGKRTVADPYAFILTQWSVNTPKSWKEYPNVKRFMEKMYEDEAVKKVLELSK